MVTQAVKATQQDDVIEGWAMPVGRDRQGETFTPDTDFAMDWFPERPLLLEHGLSEAGPAPVGKVTGWERWPEGVKVRAKLDRASPHFQLIKELVAKGKLFFSSGSMRHLVKTTRDGIIQRWPWVELSLTENPANRMATVDFATAKGMYATAGLKFAPPAWTVPGGTVHYYRLAQSADATKVFFASNMAAVCAEDLGLVGWRLKWFEPATAADHDYAITDADQRPYFGFVKSDERAIFLNVDVPVDDVKVVTCHEARHAWHKSWDENGASRPPTADEERDCERYAAAMVDTRTVTALAGRY